MGGIRNAYTMSVGKPEGKRPLRRPRHIRKYVYNIKLHLEESYCSYQSTVADFWEYGNRH
jgi:hypothetical protein